MICDPKPSSFVVDNGFGTACLSHCQLFLIFVLSFNPIGTLCKVVYLFTQCASFSDCPASVNVCRYPRSAHPSLLFISRSSFLCNCPLSICIGMFYSWQVFRILSFVLFIYKGHPLCSHVCSSIWMLITLIDQPNSNLTYLVNLGQLSFRRSLLLQKRA